MGVVEVLDPVAPARASGWKVDVSRGERNGRVSSEWFNRPDDERYLSLDDLWANVKGRSERSRSRVVQTADIRVEAARDSAERLHLVLPKAHEPVAPTHWAFGQLASIVGAPASYLRQLPAPLAGINLQYGLARADRPQGSESADDLNSQSAKAVRERGRGQSPEVRTTQGGTKITNFTLATSRPRLSEGRVQRDENGYRVMDTEWHRITCFNGLGKTVAEHCEKGMKVMVHGRIHYTKWTDAAGVDRYGCEIIAEKVDFLSRPKAGEGEDPELVDREDQFAG